MICHDQVLLVNAVADFPTNQPTHHHHRGPTTASPTVSDTPTLPPCNNTFCGNGVIDPGEECDNGERNDNMCGNCTKECRFPRCGDGLIHKCIKMDDKRNTHQRRNHYKRQYECHDCGEVEFNCSFEECDDGNHINGDGCSSKCRFEMCHPYEYDKHHNKTYDLSVYRHCQYFKCYNPPDTRINPYEEIYPEFNLIFWLHNHCVCVKT